MTTLLAQQPHIKNQDYMPILCKFILGIHTHKRNMLFTKIHIQQYSGWLLFIFANNQNSNVPC